MVSEKPERSYFLILEVLKNFPYKLIVTASLLYVLKADKQFHKNPLLSESGDICNLLDQVPMTQAGQQAFANLTTLDTYNISTLIFGLYIEPTYHSNMLSFFFLIFFATFTDFINSTLPHLRIWIFK